MIETVIWMSGIALITHALGALVSRINRVMLVALQREQLRDRIFRDACDTIHHLRCENDALTDIIMETHGEQK